MMLKRSVRVNNGVYFAHVYRNSMYLSYQICLFFLSSFLYFFLYICNWKEIIIINIKDWTL